VDDDSFFIFSFNGFAYYHADQTRKNDADNKRRCAVDELNRFESMIKSFKEKGSNVEKEGSSVKCVGEFWLG
jgi:hypothetical protein